MQSLQYSNPRFSFSHVNPALSKVASRSPGQWSALVTLHPTKSLLVKVHNVEQEWWVLQQLSHIILDLCLAHTAHQHGDCQDHLQQHKYQGFF